MLNRSVVEKVKSALLNNKQLRDDDMLLAANIWYAECGALQIEKAYDLLQAIAKSKLTHFEAIARVRRKLQEEFQELRGAKYKERHAYVPEFKKELEEFVDKNQADLFAP